MSNADNSRRRQSRSATDLRNFFSQQSQQGGRGSGNAGAPHQQRQHQAAPGRARVTGPFNVVRDLRVLPDDTEAPVSAGMDGVSSPNDAVIGGEGVDVAAAPNQQSAARETGPTAPTGRTAATNPAHA
ncbi:hypothetical protein THAOC_23298 [Thalassiosira oceanica]|uniref:Uncharacterized protein n=1 Tax=Thalassiosira oceanica TaxID=159749 RepID=K0S795_THAOC|nr:hypothetical protein THAOC_23298 [Thalassiosira oceanica]|eukprot:EJK56751.1 hypothetical protein THAOC_23298 [Thalassiosira oceanica]